MATRQRVAAAAQRVAAVAAVTAAMSAYVRAQWQEYQSLRADEAECSELLTTAEAMNTRVVRIPALLSDAEISSIEELHEDLSGQLGTAGRTAGNQAAAYRQGKWETAYLSTDGLFARHRPALRSKLLAAVMEVDRSEGWGLLDRVKPERLAPRCVELHSVQPGGSLPYPHHYDAGSLITIDVMLSDRADFEGGDLRTLESSGEMLTHAPFERGDALVFVSHKPHCVDAVARGLRRVLVMECWEGEERECAHRCERHFGPCTHTVRDSFFRRALSDLASDL